MENLQKFSEEKVDELIRGLKERYNDFSVNEKTWEVSAEDFETEAQNFRNGGYGGAGIWLTNDNGKVLLVRNKGDDSWGDPGGHHENGECFEETARRETREEAGVKAEITGIETADKVKLQQESDDSKYIFNLLVVFRGKHVSGKSEPQQDEIEEVKWWSKHPENVLYEDLKQFAIPYGSDKDR